MHYRKFYTCCFIGHRNTTLTYSEIKNLLNLTKKLISQKQVITFLFGSNSQFNDICLKVINRFKSANKLKSIYIRAEYENIDNNYRAYLLSYFDKTIFPKVLNGSNRLIYIKRNEYMIDNSDYCIFYYDKNSKNTGTKNAYMYAIKKHKTIFNIKKE